MKKKLLTLTIVGCSAALTACNATLQTTWDSTKSFAGDHKGLVVGCLSGAALGYVTEGDRGALIGLAAGCGAGYYYDRQRKKMRDLAQQLNMDLALDEVEVSVLGTDNTTKTNTKLLSSSFVHHSPMFATGSAGLSPEAKKLVEKLAEDYKASGAAVMVVGHSDSSGSAHTNQKLSENRAKAVATLLTVNGVDKDKIYFQGVGESQPIAPNSTAEGKNLNRRVEFVELGVEAVPQGSESKKSLSKAVTDRSFVNYAATQQAKLRNVTYRETKQKTGSSTAVVDFGGSEVDTNQSPLYQYLGEPEAPTLVFGLFSKAYADRNSSVKYYSCAESEPARTGEVKSLSGKINNVAQHQYVPGMNSSVWLSHVNGHLVSLTEVKVVKDNFQVVGNPVGSIYKNHSGRNDKPVYKERAIAETYEGKDSFLYRVYFEGQNKPMECMDLVMPKNANGKHQAVAGLIYYQDNDVLKAADFRPKKI